MFNMDEKYEICVCVCVCVYMCACVCVCVHAFVYVHAIVCVCVCVHACMHACVSICVPVYPLIQYNSFVLKRKSCRFIHKIGKLIRPNHNHFIFNLFV